MDLVVLRRLVAEIGARLVGQRVDQVHALPRYDVAVATSARGRPRLWFSADPADPHLYLRTGSHASPARPPAFAMAARKWTRGQRITNLETVGDDRVVQLAVASGARLIFELVPRRATAFVLDPEGRVAAVWNPRRGRPVPGVVWTPPARRSRPDSGAITDDEWRRVDALPDERALVSALMRGVDGTTQLVAREVAARRDEARPVHEIVEEELQRAASAPTAPRIYAPAPLAELSTDPGPQRLLLAPYELRQAADLHEIGYADLTSAATDLQDTRSRLRRATAVRLAVTAAARSRLRAIDRIRNKMEARRSEPADVERHRRLGDILLASPGARVIDGLAQVVNIHGDGEPMTVAVDPGLSLVDNAQDYYRRARRAERRVRHQAERERQLDAEQAALQTLLDDAEAVADDVSVDRLIGRARRLGLAVQAERMRVPAASRSKAAAERTAAATGRADSSDPGPGIRRYRTAAGAEILVGRSAKGNDRLSHRVAAKDDWWLHAGGPGAHVVLRNPSREAEPPAGDLRIAAAVAAWFSKGRGATKCEVHWTRARQLKRPRGGAPGLVMLREHRTLLVEPASPEALGLDELA